MAGTRRGPVSLLLQNKWQQASRAWPAGYAPVQRLSFQLNQWVRSALVLTMYGWYISGYADWRLR